MTLPYLENAPNSDLLPFEIKVDVKNRADRRAVTHEIERNFSKLRDIELNFCESLFVENETKYTFIYGVYLNIWNNQIAVMVGTGCFKYTLPKIGYFIDNYKPREKEG